MNNYLLDTQVFIWWMEKNKRLSLDAASIIEDPANRIFLSVATPWEIVTKVRIKKLKLPKNFARQIINSIFELLPIQITHVLNLKKLPLHHKDPFDRIFISQAKVENLTLITSDEKIWRYDLSLMKT